MIFLRQKIHIINTLAVEVYKIFCFYKIFYNKRGNVSYKFFIRNISSCFLHSGNYTIVMFPILVMIFQMVEAPDTTQTARMLSNWLVEVRDPPVPVVVVVLPK